MFYEEPKIKSVLDCKKCNQRLDEPKMLPCGSNLCTNCVLLLINEKISEFVCPTCSAKHKVPPDGLPTNEALVSLLNLEPNEISRGGVARDLRTQLSSFQKDIQHFSNGLENGVDTIKEHCCNLKHQVQLATEQIILEINTSNEKFMSKIDKYGKGCIQSFESKRNEKSELKNFIGDLKMFCKEWDDYLNEFEIDDKLMQEALETAKKLAEKSGENKLALEKLCFNGKPMKLFQKNEMYSDDLIGELSIPSSDLELSTILYPQQRSLLDLCGFSSGNFKLIYRGSRDGFGSNVFHSLCDQKPQTLVLIRSTNNYIFGGYTEQDWSGNNVNKTDPKAFVFSLVNATNKPQKFSCTNINNAVYCNPSNGPVFGGPNRDLLISNNCNSTSCSSVPNSYSIPSNSFLAGNTSFTVTEIEVFTKED